MRKVFVVIAAVVFSICIGAGAFAQEKKGEAAPKSTASTPKPKTVKERVVTKTATVEAIDLKNRVLTLKDKDGNVGDLKVSEKVKNLPQVKVGDQVTAKFYESVAIELADPGTPVQAGTAKTVSKAELGEKPAGGEVHVTSVVASIVAIDAEKNVATLKGPEGKTVNVKIQDPKKWQSAKVGDNVRITYIEGLAINVKPVKTK